MHEMKIKDKAPACLSARPKACSMIWRSVAGPRRTCNIERAWMLILLSGATRLAALVTESPSGTRHSAMP